MCVCVCLFKGKDGEGENKRKEFQIKVIYKSIMWDFWFGVTFGREGASRVGMGILYE